MRLKSSFLFLILFFLFFPFSTAQAANLLDVVINEIAWMGTEINYQDEWLELYNNAKSSINLEGWQLKAADDTPKINLRGIIPANSFYLLERTDDNALPGITADQIYSGVLGNKGENLKFYDNLGNLIDVVDCSSGWFGGDNRTKQTMERKNTKASGSDPANWKTSQNAGGTPKTKNSEGIEISLPSVTAITDNLATEPLSKTSLEPNQVTALADVVINEILPSPEGPDAEEEWIEVFNQNNFEVDLAGWKIEDVSGKITTYTFPSETKISPQGFLVLPRTETKITLNNDGDGVSLTSPAGNIIDQVNYEKAPQGKAYNRVNSNWTWSNNLTPGAANIVEKTEIRSLEDQSTSEARAKKELAAIGEQTPKSSKFLFVLLIALAIAIFSGIMILILKKKLKPKQVL